MHDKLGGAGVGVAAGIGQLNLVVSYAQAHVCGGNFNFWQLHIQRLFPSEKRKKLVQLKFCIVIDCTKSSL